MEAIIINNINKSIFAGLSIGLGGILFLNCENKTIGAFLFSIGLFSVLVFGFDLFTGKVCNKYFLKKPFTLITIWVGNLIGAVAIGLLSSVNNSTYIAANNVIINKLSKPVPLIDGVVCGICIAIAVKGYKFAEGFGKYLAIILGVMVFILCGSEHCVADMYYFAAARIINLEVVKFILLVTVGNILGGALFSGIGD